ncbi:MAG: hypothetical protein ABI346_04695, partial [Candidatus Baltobacteraceae bacterium]
RLAAQLAPSEVARLRGVLDACPDPGAALARARGGETLDDVDFFELSRFVDALAALALGRLPAALAFPEFAVGDTLAATLAPGRTSRRTFYLADAYDPQLANARALEAKAQSRFDAARTRLAERVAAAVGLERIRDGEFFVMRDAYAEVALPPNVRVVREAATYVACELALDEATLATLAERERAAETVAEAEERVRARLSDAARMAAAQCEAAILALGELDRTLGRVAFAQRHRTCVPEVVARASIAFEAGRFLPLEASLGERGRPYAPISLDVEGVATLTGPNMGGKSAALRTCGFLAACVARGLPVPAERARIGLFDEIAWLGIAERAHDGALLSAFGREVVELRALLERGARRPLVLIDEFARTTSPREARALLIALLQRLRDAGACALAATHLAGIASQAGATHYAVVGLRDLPTPARAASSLDDALARIGAAMDYSLARIEDDAPPPSDAIALAALLGLDAALIARARAALSDRA